MKSKRNKKTLSKYVTLSKKRPIKLMY